MIPSESKKDDGDDGEDNGYNYNPVFPIFDWRGAVSRYILYHCILYHLCFIQIIHQTNRHRNKDTDSTLTKICEDDFTEDIKEAESKHWVEFDGIWSCTHCRDLPTEAKPDTFDGVKQHISIFCVIYSISYISHSVRADITLNRRFLMKIISRILQPAICESMVRLSSMFATVGMLFPYQKEFVAIFP